MSNRPCAVGGCSAPAKGFSPLCSAHRNNRDRHGHPQQTSVTTHDLRPYLRMVEARRARNPGNAAWSMLEQRWSAAVSAAADMLARWESGRACVRWQVDAADQLCKLHGTVAPTAIINTALAIFIMRAAEPRRFMSEQGFRHQLVRVVRRLAPMSVGSYWNHKTQKVHKVYKDPAPRKVSFLADYLIAAFGLAGAQMAELELNTEDRAAVARQRLVDAIGALA